MNLIDRIYGYDGIALTNDEGIIVYVNRDKAIEFVGTPLQDLDLQTYQQGKKGVYFSQIIEDVGGDGLPDLFVSAPITDDENNLIGIVVLDVPIQRQLSEAMKLTYVGETGETLVVTEINDQLVFLHPVRFEGNAVLQVMEIDGDASGPAKKALLGVEGSGLKIDYRNESVLSAWRYSPSLDWGLVSKIDVSEAFAPIRQLQQDIIILSLVFTVGIVIFGITASRSFSGPILKLKDLAKKISEGDLETRVSVHSSDEIGQLSEMMNDTVLKLKQEKNEKNNFNQ